MDQDEKTRRVESAARVIVDENVKAKAAEMTEQPLPLDDDKIRAEIIRVLEEVPHIRAEKHRIMVNLILAIFFGCVAILAAGAAAMKYLF